MHVSKQPDPFPAETDRIDRTAPKQIIRSLMQELQILPVTLLLRVLLRDESKRHRVMQQRCLPGTGPPEKRGPSPLKARNILYGS